MHYKLSEVGSHTTQIGTFLMGMSISYPYVSKQGTRPIIDFLVDKNDYYITQKGSI